VLPQRLTIEESVSAAREGWKVEEVDGQQRILRVRNPQSYDQSWSSEALFDSDGAALRWVLGRGAAGSQPHLRALRMHYGSVDTLNVVIAKIRDGDWDNVMD
jgi:hypothetical protein